MVLFPVLEELGRKYQNHSTVTIAKIDITANDIELMYQDRYPFFRFFPTDSQKVRGSWDSHNWKCYIIVKDSVSLSLPLPFTKSTSFSAPTLIIFSYSS